MIRSGDTIHTPPGEWHWHGAAPDHFMTHLAMQEAAAEIGRALESVRSLAEDEVLRGLGYSDDDLRRFREEGVT